MMINRYGLKTPFFGLAPMANISTYPFASQCIDYGADIVWTPMVHTDTIVNNWPEAKRILDFKDIKNYVVQIVGSEPDNFVKAVQIITKELEPLGIDLNFACPDKNIVKSGCGGAMMKDFDRLINIVKAVKKATNLPLSVKTRAGWDNRADIFELTNRLEAIGIDMLTVHPRTVEQGFRGEADWSVISKLVKAHPNLFICGSGDISDWQDAIGRQQKSGCAGVIIGRFALGAPWIFRAIAENRNYAPKRKEIRELVMDLAEKADGIWGDKGIIEARKHFAWYFKGFPGAATYRKKLMDSKTLPDVRRMLS
jgi:tRNA-dihydrouridine synthase B